MYVCMHAVDDGDHPAKRIACSESIQLRSIVIVRYLCIENVASQVTTVRNCISNTRNWLISIDYVSRRCVIVNDRVDAGSVSVPPTP